MVPLSVLYDDIQQFPDVDEFSSMYGMFEEHNILVPDENVIIDYTLKILELEIYGRLPTGSNIQEMTWRRIGKGMQRFSHQAT